MDIFTQPDGNILIYTLRYNNTSNSRVDLIDYFSEISTPSGSTVKAKAITRDAVKRAVPANSSLSVTYHANIGKSSQVNGIKVSVFGWDFESANYQKKIGTLHDSSPVLVHCSDRQEPENHGE
ncbi:hypothetical protein J14TS5_46740 [Paenibacillus lautus]|nr:hypothetical protein J14TS5_46740 [Paenibacillus lautus]